MKKSVSNASRRLFLQQSAAFSTLGLGAPLAMNLAAMSSAAAQTASDYKALVCIFLQGGNDAYNTVLATDAPSWQAYTAVRNQAPSSIALAGSSLLPLSPASALPGGRTLALHPRLKGVQHLFNHQRRLAIVSNVGPLLEPLSKAEYIQATKRYPAKLFSHNDQQSTWQAMAPEGAALGWGGRLADALASGNGNSLFTGVSAAGNAVWVSGQNVKQYQITPSGVARMGIVTNEKGVDHIYGGPAIGTAMQRIVAGTRGTHRMEMDVASVSERSMAAEKVLSAVLPSAEIAPFGPTASKLMYIKADGSSAINPLAQQLQVVARTIAARSSLGMKRQVFFVSLGGFDTHDEQNTRHADLMARLDHALEYFNGALNSMGAADDVTTFTASDFGRTLTSNGDGTDHGWGSHHFVMGGAVRGGTVVGEVPQYAVKNLNNNNFDGSPDLLTNGAMLPKVSVDQYGAALGRWFGAGSAVSSIFPSLGNFSTSNLPIMR